MKTTILDRILFYSLGGVLFFVLFSGQADAQLFWPRYTVPAQCPNGQCARPTPPKKETPPDVAEEEKEEQKTAEEPEEDVIEEPVEVLSVKRERFTAASVEIADECDKILNRLVERYGEPKGWQSFPIYFKRYTGNGIAGYTLYTGSVVSEVVVYEPLSSAVGGTLDHELTHAFFFYYLGSNFDLMFNEGLAQNSEYRRRDALRYTVFTRYTNGDFWALDRLYGRNSYDSGLRIYHQGFSVVDYLIGRGGSQWFAAFMDDLVKSKDIDCSLSRYYDYKSLYELQKAWVDYIMNGQDRSSVRAVY